MRVFWAVLVWVFFGLSTVFADRISAPPPLNKENIVPLQNYLRAIYDNQFNLEVVTTNPDGSRRGRRGDILLLQTGGSSYLEVNTDSSTTWRGVALSDTP